MPSDELIFELIRDLPFLLIKIFTVILLFMHVLFSIIIVRQTKNMVKIVEAQISPTIYLISMIHLFASLGVLVWAVVILFLLPGII